MPRIGTKVANRYEVIDVIGEGGFAVVYRARDTQLGGLVALKVLEPSKSMDQGFTKRFEQEVTLVRELNHHNTIKIWDAGATEWGCLYYAMEVVEGQPLAMLIQRTRGLNLSRVVRIVSQVLRSLSEAHKRGIVHRDLKPGNIMVCQFDDEPDYVKVLDFGIAKARSTELTKVKTQTGMVMCTPNYAAPELLRNQDISPATDLYALGLIVAEMVTGQQAVQADSLVDVITVQASSEPLTFDARLMSLPVGRVIARATAKNIEERYQSAREMLGDLRALGTQPPAPMPAPSTPAVGVPDSIAMTATTQLATDPGVRAHPVKPGVARLIPILLGVIALLAIALVVVTKLLPSAQDERAHNLVEGEATAGQVAGATMPPAPVVAAPEPEAPTEPVVAEPREPPREIVAHLGSPANTCVRRVRSLKIRPSIRPNSSF